MFLYIHVYYIYNHICRYIFTHTHTYTCMHTHTVKVPKLYKHIFSGLNTTEQESKRFLHIS